MFWVYFFLFIFFVLVCWSVVCLWLLCFSFIGFFWSVCFCFLRWLCWCFELCFGLCLLIIVVRRVVSIIMRVILWGFVVFGFVIVWGVGCILFRVRSFLFVWIGIEWVVCVLVRCFSLGLKWICLLLVVSLGFCGIILICWGLGWGMWWWFFMMLIWCLWKSVKMFLKR